ncbi:MAG: GTPase Era [Thermodesulfobacteriota bacterium]|nr:GTPase Era [Thermodesulfobacteriota bacterium]
MTNVSDHSPAPFHSGFIAICGPPNAGKSTLLNRLTGEKISITSRKPQTTRNRILGVVNRDTAQLVFMDTPGIFRAKGQLNTRIVDTAVSAMSDVDVILLMIDIAAPPHRDGENLSLQRLHQIKKPVILALNKIDNIKKPQILEAIDRWRNSYEFDQIIPISAKHGLQTEELMEAVEALLPEGFPLFPEDILTDVPVRFIAAEMIREKVFRLTGQEIPYATAVTIDTFTEAPDDNRITIQATIHVEKNSQKGIIIGKRGAMLKKIGQQSRQDIQRLTGARVFLELFVRVQRKWSSNARILKDFGYS